MLISKFFFNIFFSNNILRYWTQFLSRPRSRTLESQTDGLQSLSLAKRLKPWLRTIYGLQWLMAASHGLQVQTRRVASRYIKPFEHSSRVWHIHGQTDGQTFLWQRYGRPIIY